MPPVPFALAKRRGVSRRQRQEMQAQARMAFMDMPMLDNAALIVWTKAQMRGVRAMLKRMGFGCSA